jgi:hypothetical protein
MSYYAIVTRDCISEEIEVWGPYGDDLMSVEQEADDLRRSYEHIRPPINVQVLPLQNTDRTRASLDGPQT